MRFLLTNFPLGSILIFFIIIYQFFLLRSKHHDDKLKDLIKTETELNRTPSKPLPEQYFITPDLSSIQFLTKDDMTHIQQNISKRIIRSQEAVLQASTKPMVRITHTISNDELKSNFGVKTLTELMEFDKNCSQYTSSLRRLADNLILGNFYENAINVLTECINTGSETSKTYTLLADCYSLTNNTKQLEQLTNDLTNDKYLSHNKIGKHKALTHISNLLNAN